MVQTLYRAEKNDKFSTRYSITLKIRHNQRRWCLFTVSLYNNWETCELLRGDTGLARVTEAILTESIWKTPRSISLALPFVYSQLITKKDKDKARHIGTANNGPSYSRPTWVLRPSLITVLEQLSSSSSKFVYINEGRYICITRSVPVIRAKDWHSKRKTEQKGTHGYPSRYPEAYQTYLEEELRNPAFWDDFSSVTRGRPHLRNSVWKAVPFSAEAGSAMVRARFGWKMDGYLAYGGPGCRKQGHPKHDMLFILHGVTLVAVGCALFPYPKRKLDVYASPTRSLRRSVSMVRAIDPVLVTLIPHSDFISIACVQAVL